MKTLIFEDAKWVNLTPLTYTRPVFELRCGFGTLLDKIIEIVGKEEIILFVRDYLVNLTKRKYNYEVNSENVVNDDLLIINGRWLIDKTITLDLEDEQLYVSKGDLVYGIIRKETVNKYWNSDINAFLKKLMEDEKIEKKEADFILINFMWDLIVYNSKIISYEFKKKQKFGIYGKFSEKSCIYGEEKNVYISESAEILPNVVIDVSEGPVYIDKNVKIYPFSVIIGPCFIGEKTQIMPGAKIREGNSFGPFCRIGGEVEESIFHSYSNKYHDGFIGHSYIGEFVNLGALTTNSDLKNDYSNVSVYLNGKIFDTGLLKVGSFIGDHTKTSIGTLFNTGTIAGVMCNITANNLLPKYFPSFVWFVNGKFMKGYGVDYSLQTAKIAMERRNRILLPEEEEVYKKIFEITEKERKEYIEKSRKVSK